MKKLISLLSLSLCCFVALAQPTSFGGITPGKTTLEELKGLVVESQDVASIYLVVKLKQPENQQAFVKFHNGVVYEVSIGFLSSEGVKEALIAKYGEPQIKLGKIKTVSCQNKIGGVFSRYEGSELRLWPVKDGVQGGVKYSARGACAEYVSEDYVLRHVATLAAIEKKAAEEARSKAEKQRSKLDGAL